VQVVPAPRQLVFAPAHCVCTVTKQFVGAPGVVVQHAPICGPHVVAVHTVPNPFHVPRSATQLASVRTEQTGPVVALLMQHAPVLVVGCADAPATNPNRQHSAAALVRTNRRDNVEPIMASLLMCISTRNLRSAPPAGECRTDPPMSIMPRKRQTVQSDMNSCPLTSVFPDCDRA
jgi:hypothetical protein